MNAALRHVVESATAYQAAVDAAESQPASRRIPAPADLPDALRGENLAHCLRKAADWLAEFARLGNYPQALSPIVELLRIAGVSFAALEDEHLGLIDRHDGLMAEWDERGQRIAQLERDLARAEKARDELLLADDAQPSWSRP